MSEAATMDSDEAMAQSFSLANIVGQSSVLNRGVWAKDVEKPTRKYAMRSARGVYVLTGPIYSKPARTIGPDQVFVPDQLFKLVYDPAAKKAWAFILPNTDDAQVTRVYSYDELVRITGMQLLPPGAL
jgi:endonuclease G